MNIYSYDPVSIKIDWTKTYINFRKSIIYSQEMKLKTYFFVATKFDNKTKTTGVYIVFTDIEPTDNRVFGKATLDACGRFRTSLKDVLSKYYYPHENTIENIEISVDDEDEDSIAYHILSF